MIPISRRAFIASAGISVFETAFPLLSEPADQANQSYQANPAFHPDPRIDDIFRDLASPLHATLMRDPERVVIAGREADLSRGYSLEISENEIVTKLAVTIADFHQFMFVSMGVNRSTGAYPVRAAIGSPDNCPPGSQEAFHITIDTARTLIVARDAEGIRRALFYLEDEMLTRRAPALPLGSCFRWAQIDLLGGQRDRADLPTLPAANTS